MINSSVDNYLNVKLKISRAVKRILSQSTRNSSLIADIGYNIKDPLNVQLEKTNDPIMNNDKSNAAASTQRTKYVTLNVKRRITSPKSSDYRGKQVKHKSVVIKNKLSKNAIDVKTSVNDATIDLLTANVNAGLSKENEVNVITNVNSESAINSLDTLIDNCCFTKSTRRPYTKVKKLNANSTKIIKDTNEILKTDTITRVEYNNNDVTTTDFVDFSSEVQKLSVSLQNTACCGNQKLNNNDAQFETFVTSCKFYLQRIAPFSIEEESEFYLSIQFREALMVIILNFVNIISNQFIFFTLNISKNRYYF